nr:hypothetical protein [Elizabethkingia bruuniana]
MNTQAITFSNIAWENAGTLYFPENFDQNKNTQQLLQCTQLAAAKSRQREMYTEKL